MSAMAECEVAMANPGVQAALPELNLMLARHGFEAEPLCWREGRVRGRHEDWRFRSVFQPVYRLQDGEPRLWSVEALARVSDRFGGQLIPTVLFAAETTPRRTVYVDRQLRCLHLLNFLLQSPPPGLLLSLNVNAQHLVNVSESHGQFFAEALQLLGWSRAMSAWKSSRTRSATRCGCTARCSATAIWAFDLLGRLWPGRVQSGTGVAAGA